MYNTYTSVQHSDMTIVNLMFLSLRSRKHWTAARTVGSSVAIRRLMAHLAQCQGSCIHTGREIGSQSFNLNCV